MGCISPFPIYSDRALAHQGTMLVELRGPSAVAVAPTELMLLLTEKGNGDPPLERA